MPKYSDEHRKLLNDLFISSKGYPEPQEIAQLEKSTGLTHAKLTRWFYRKRYLQTNKKRKKTEDGFESETNAVSSSVRGSSVEIKPELNELPLKKKPKTQSARRSDGLLVVKAEILEDTLPPSSPPSSPHISTENQDILQPTPVDTKQQLPLSPSRSPNTYRHISSYPRPARPDTSRYTLETDGLTMESHRGRSIPAQQDLPPSASFNIAAAFNTFLAECYPSLSPQQILAALAAQYSLPINTVQPRFQSSFPLQQHSNIQSPPHHVTSAQQLSPMNPLDDFSTFQQARRRYAHRGPTPLYQQHSVPGLGPYGSSTSPGVPSTIIQSVPDHNPAMINNTEQLTSASVANLSLIFNESQFQSNSSNPFDPQLTPLQHLNVLEPLLNVNTNGNFSRDGNTISSAPMPMNAAIVRNRLLRENPSQVMDRLLDEGLVEADPFQAAMGLVWLQRAGMIQ